MTESNGEELLRMTDKNGGDNYPETSTMRWRQIFMFSMRRTFQEEEHIYKIRRQERARSILKTSIISAWLKGIEECMICLENQAEARS